MPIISRMARLGLQVLKNASRTAGTATVRNFRTGGLEGAVKAMLIFILSILFVFGMVVMAIWYLAMMLFKSVLCMALLNFFHGQCPEPLFNGKNINTVAKRLELNRDAAVKKGDDGQIFEGQYEISLSDTKLSKKEIKEFHKKYHSKRGVLKIEDDKLIVSEARLYLLALQQLDEEVINIYGKNPAHFRKGESLSDSNYGRTLSTLTNDWEKTLKEKKFTKEISKFRLDVWRCYLMAESLAKVDIFGIEVGAPGWETLAVAWNQKNPACKTKGVEDQFRFMEMEEYNETKKKDDEDGEEDSGKTEEEIEDLYYGVMTKLNDDGKVENKKIMYLLDNYYPVSLYYGLPNGKEMFEERLAQIKEELDIKASVDIDITTGSGGVIMPIPYRTYNHALQVQQFKGRNPPHQGTDLGTGGVVNIPVFSPQAGVVNEIGGGESSSAGFWVVIDHPDGYSTRFLHLHPGSIVVEKGQQLAKGQLVAGVGGSGGYDPHLHYDICTTGPDYAPATDQEMGSYSYNCSTNTNLNPEMNPFNLDFGMPTYQLPEWQQKWKNEFEKNLKPRALKGEVIIMPGVVDFGEFTAQCETNGCSPPADWGICNPDPRTGHLDCGGLQLTSGGRRDYPLGQFVNFVKDRDQDMYEKLTKYDYLTESNKFADAWRDVNKEKPSEHRQYQIDYMMETHYYQIADWMRDNLNYDPRTKASYLQEIVFGSSIQIRACVYQSSGPCGGRGGSVLDHAGLNNKSSGGLTDEEYILKFIEGKKKRYPGAYDTRYNQEIDWVKQQASGGESEGDDIYQYIDVDEYLELASETMAEFAEKNKDLDRSDNTAPSWK